MAPNDKKLIAKNSKASMRFEVEDHIEAGLVLTGSEVKSLRAGRASLDGTFALFVNGEIFLYGMHIAPYASATAYGHEPVRERKLLLKRSQIEKWEPKVASKGYTMVPLSLYFTSGFVKVDLGLAKGKRVGDNREQIRKEVDRKELREVVLRGKRQ